MDGFIHVHLARRQHQRLMLSHQRPPFLKSAGSLGRQQAGGALSPRCLPPVGRHDFSLYTGYL